MNVRNLLWSSALLFSTLALPLPGLAVQGGLVSSVGGILVNSDPLPPPATTGLLYGGCMAYLTNPISTASGSPNCPSNWVAFSCDGTYTSKETARLLLDQAQLAWAKKNTVYVTVDDTKLHNGYCTATRFDLW